MKGRYFLQKIRKESGERLCMIVERELGLPLYYENIYLEFIRTINKKEVNTIIRYAYALMKFKEYIDSANINLSERMQSSTLLNFNELYSLTCFFNEKKILKIESIKKKIKSENDNISFKLSVIEKYLIWIYSSFYSDSFIKTKNITELLSQSFKYFKPKQVQKGYVGKVDSFKALDEKAVEDLMHITSSKNNDNPFEIKNRLRNELIIKILHETGMRSGELLNLKIGDFYYEKKYLDIVRRYNAPEDTRSIPLCVKTEEREIPISLSLTRLIDMYINVIRPKYSMKKDNGYIFITHKSGPHQGAPMTYSAYYKIACKIKNPKVHNNNSLGGFTMHALRHTWNHEYNKKFEEASGLDKYFELEKIRHVRMGWKIKSSTALIYNKKYIYDKATKAFKELDDENGNLTEVKSYENADYRKALGLKSKR